MQIKGIRIKIHPTFLALLVVCIALGLAARAFLVFGLVLLHEAAHILTARGYGIKVVSVELYPYGGTAVLEDTFEGKKAEETVIAFAGPAVNILLFFLAQYIRWEGLLRVDWAFEFARINFWLAVFNLIPVLPLDGGRIARALLAGSFGFVRTTRTLAAAGKWLGGLFIVLGFLLYAYGCYMFEPSMFIVLGMFFWIGSGKELANARIVFLKHLSKKKELLLRKGFMPSSCLAVSRETPLSRIVDEFTTDRYSLVNVVGRKDNIEKTLSETEVVQGMLDQGLSCKVGELVKNNMHR